MSSDEAELAQTLETWRRLDDARQRRSARAHLTTLLSLPLGVLAFQPALFGGVATRAVLTFWAMSLVATAAALVEEWRLALRVARHRPG